MLSQLISYSKYLIHHFSWSYVGSSFVQNVLLHFGICWVALQHFVAHIDSIHKAAGLQIVECKLVAYGW